MNKVLTRARTEKKAEIPYLTRDVAVRAPLQPSIAQDLIAAREQAYGWRKVGGYDMRASPENATGI